MVNITLLEDRTGFDADVPFKDAKHNLSYGNLMVEAKKLGVDVALSHPRMYCEGGLVKRFWKLVKTGWEQKTGIEVEGVFIRYAPHPLYDYIRRELETTGIRRTCHERLPGKPEGRPLLRTRFSGDQAAPDHQLIDITQVVNAG